MYWVVAGYGCNGVSCVVVWIYWRVFCSGMDIMVCFMWWYGYNSVFCVVVWM